MLIPSLVSLAIEPYNPTGLYGQMYPALKGDIEIVQFQYIINWNDILHLCEDKRRVIW